MRRPVVFAIALALGAMALTAPGGASAGEPTIAAVPAAAPEVTTRTQPPEAQPVASPSPASGGAPASTPLALRRSRPIELAPETRVSTGLWKIALVLAIVAGTALALLGRRLRPAPLAGRSMTVVSRLPAGFRSELLIVSVERQRLLLGVTPQSIQMLAVLDADEPESVPDARDSADAVRSCRGAASLGERFAAMLESAASGQEGGSARPAPAPRVSVEADDDLAEQARGLAALRRTT